jgi:TonB-dependent starch-binding outer membrane protein SusC
MRKTVLLLMAIVLAVGQVIAQKTVTGKVTDENGNPLAGASVVITGTNTGVVTKNDGSFMINVGENAKTLTISNVGFESQTIAITGAIATVSLRHVTNPLDEVVVVGYQARKKRDEAGAISTVKAKDIENIPNASLDKALQGKAAGVVVQANNGIPGGAVNVRIRGNGSLQAGNNPLYIVDGVQININDNSNFTQNNPLSFLNPDDIESIDILKDAASGAIYGSNAANGVVIITTKKGRAGKTKFNFNVYGGQAAPIKYFDVANGQQYYQLRLEAYANNSPLSPLVDMKRAVLTELRVPGAAGFSDKQADSAAAALPTYDWQRKVFRNGKIQSYELSATGGNDRTTFRLSGSYQKQETVVTKADFSRAAIKFDINNKATDRVTISSTVNLSTVLQTNPFSTSGSFLGSAAFSSSGIVPTNPIYNPDGTYYGVPGFTPANLVGVLNQNIVQVTDYDNGYTKTNQLVGNLRVDYRIVDWLSFAAQGNIDYRLLYGRNVLDARTADAFARKGLTQVQDVINTNLSAFTTLNFNYTFDVKHKVDGLLGYEYRTDYQYQSSASGDNFPIYLLTYLQNAGAPVGVNENYTGYKRNGIFAAANYTYNGKYILGATVRRDGSSRFGSNNRFGTFPSIKAAWNVDREDFMNNVPFISSLKLRVGYGTTGNDQIGNFDNRDLFTTGGVYNGGAGLNYTQLGNPDLKWETNTTLNFGIDFGLMQNRITGIVELYNKENSDLLISQPLPGYTGFTSIATNVGAMTNKGVEVTLGADVIKAKSLDRFNWHTNFTFAYNKNQVKKLYGGLKILPGNNGIQVGQPRNVLFTQKFAGVNPATGRPMWYDTLGNLTYVVAAKDRQIIGPTELPPYTGGWSNTFTFKRFTLDAFLQYQYGLLQSDGQVNFIIENIARINDLKDVYDGRWTTPGQVTWFPRFLLNGTEPKGSGAQSGNRTWFKADYIRLKNVTLAYDFDPKLLKKYTITNLRIYAQATNLWTYSDWFSYDIEFVGTATGIVPQTRNITVGIQLGL